jgi:hypothetical protein
MIEIRTFLVAVFMHHVPEGRGIPTVFVVLIAVLIHAITIIIVVPAAPSCACARRVCCDLAFDQAGTGEVPVDLLAHKTLPPLLSHESKRGVNLTCVQVYVCRP